MVVKTTQAHFHDSATQSRTFIGVFIRLGKVAQAQMIALEKFKSHLQTHLHTADQSLIKVAANVSAGDADLRTYVAQKLHSSRQIMTLSSKWRWQNFF